MTDVVSLLHPACAIRPWGYKTEAEAEKCYSENAAIAGMFLVGFIVVILIILWAVGAISGMNFVVIAASSAIAGLFILPYISSWYGGQQWRVYNARRLAYEQQGKTSAEAFDIVVREAQNEAQIQATQQVGSNLNYAFSRLAAK